MKKYALILAAFALLFIAPGCKNEQNDPENPTQPDRPTPVETIKGNVDKPSWTVPTDYDYTSSMTAVVKVDLTIKYPDSAKDFALTDNDLLAAFIGDQCLGVSSPNDGLFYLYIVGAEGAVTLRYWSAQYTNIFEVTNAFDFHNNDNLGTVAQPLTPTFVVKK